MRNAHRVAAYPEGWPEDPEALRDAAYYDEFFPTMSFPDQVLSRGAMRPYTLGLSEAEIAALARYVTLP